MNRKLNNNILELIKKYDLDSLEIAQNSRELIIMLISEIKGCSINMVKLGEIDVTAEDFQILDNMIADIACKKTPPQYLTNKEYIYGSDFFVNENVLIPRQDTETLIEVAIDKINTKNYTSMLDLCTGSGIIGITIAKNTDICSVDLVDVSTEALNVAKKNVYLNQVQDRCNLIESNMFASLYKLNSKYDIIVSNPPYLTEKEMGDISDFVRKEPYIALYGGKDGLDYYKEIFNNAKHFLNNCGCIAVEIGYLQANDVMQIIDQHTEYIDTKVIKDINNKDRVVVCHFQSK